MKRGASVGKHFAQCIATYEKQECVLADVCQLARVEVVFTEELGGVACGEYSCREAKDACSHGRERDQRQHRVALRSVHVELFSIGKRTSEFWQCPEL